MIKRVQFQRFKRFNEHTIELHPGGLSFVVGGNNSGKSSVLQGLAIWEFCKTVLKIERGKDCLLSGSSRQGFGLSDDEFSPVLIPSLRHLWTNLHTQKDGEPDGYTLKIRCFWDGHDGEELFLETGLSLVNDRLFMKATDSNLRHDSPIPTVAYLPPFAGITDRETRVPQAIRRRLIGQGLAGAVLRNLLLDLKNRNAEERARLKGDRKKIKNTDLRALRSSDPWEILQAVLQATFSVELSVSAFNPLYHSYIRVMAYKVERRGARLTKVAGYAPRDLMVEGSGFLQWLSVYTLAVDPSVDVLLLDEPDAHLHCALQVELVDRLRSVAEQKQGQVLIATHSTEIIKSAVPDDILHIRNGSCSYLSSEDNKVGAIVGLGSDYAPRINRLQALKRVLFVEAQSDADLLMIWSQKLGIPWPGNLLVWPWASGHKERKQVFLQLASEITGLRGMSLVDRDDQPAGQVNAQLRHASYPDHPEGLMFRTWRRRHIENYLLCPPAIAAAAQVPVGEVEQVLRNEHSLAVTSDFTRSDAPAAILDARGKDIFTAGRNSLKRRFGVRAVVVARNQHQDDLCEDVRVLIQAVSDLCC